MWSCSCSRSCGAGTTRDGGRSMVRRPRKEAFDLSLAHLRVTGQEEAALEAPKAAAFDKDALKKLAEQAGSEVFWVDSDGRLRGMRKMRRKGGSVTRRLETLGTSSCAARQQKRRRRRHKLTYKLPKQSRQPTQRRRP